jgi:hypothetical protein
MSWFAGEVAVVGGAVGALVAGGAVDVGAAVIAGAAVVGGAVVGGAVVDTAAFVAGVVCFAADSEPEPELPHAASASAPTTEPMTRREVMFFTPARLRTSAGCRLRHPYSAGGCAGAAFG